MNHHDISHFRGLKTKKDTHISRKEKKGVKMERLVINIIKKLNSHERVFSGSF